VHTLAYLHEASVTKNLKVLKHWRQADFSLRSLGNQLAFFDTSRDVRQRQRRFSGDDSDSSVGRLSQEAFSIFKPRAESSPIERSLPESKHESILEKKIQISVTLYSLVLAVSLALNLGVTWYFVMR
jgi:hypothetical protein